MATYLQGYHRCNNVHISILLSTVLLTYLLFRQLRLWPNGLSQQTSTHHSAAAASCLCHSTTYSTDSPLWNCLRGSGRNIHTITESPRPCRCLLSHYSLSRYAKLSVVGVIRSPPRSTDPPLLGEDLSIAGDPYTPSSRLMLLCRDMSSNFAESWQKHIPGNLKHTSYTAHHMFYTFVLYPVRTGNEFYRIQYRHSVKCEVTRCHYTVTSTLWRCVACDTAGWLTRKPCYRKDDRAMRPIYMDAPKNFESPWLRPRLLFMKLLMGFCCNRS